MKNVQHFGERVLHIPANRFILIYSMNMVLSFLLNSIKRMKKTVRLLNFIWHSVHIKIIDILISYYETSE